ncbi:HIR complex subunit [Coniosporium apollinis]|uniref:HIR complex subunit n=1 Tax=Coniosporium apollinis TaxID=61459 RepID=A0ABQ9NUF6_9PEZI|nr:HIR complex subunit [Coniosporium apollinis]
MDRGVDAFGGRQVDEGAGSSSSPELSTPPRSPDATLESNSPFPNSTIQVGVAGRSSSANAATTSSTSAKNSNSTSIANAAATAAPVKRPRKKKDPEATTEDKIKEKKPRKPREPKDPNAPSKPRKRQKVADAPRDDTSLAQPQHSRQPKITDLVGSAQAPAQTSPSMSRPSNPELTHNPSLAHLATTPATTPRPSSSGQVYDPIRSATIESGAKHSSTNVPQQSSPSRFANRASASPSIASLIDPPPASTLTSTSEKTRNAMLQAPISVTSAPASPAVVSMKPATTVSGNGAQRPTPTHSTSIETEVDEPPAPSVTKKSPSTTTTSTTATPPAKPARQKEAPPPLPTGSGLLSGTAFGPMTAANGTAVTKGPTIWLTFNLKRDECTTINFTQEVEKKYGFAALHPRLAAQRERRRQIAAAGAALEGASGQASTDDMSLDLSEADSNADMGGVEDEASAGDAQPKRRRRRKLEDYDKEDDFIDDTEQAWEQNAMMAKDGFFVYSGPLATEEKPAAERPEGTRGRGRGRGRGGSTRGETSGRGSRGGGRGSRGGATVRKPRVTKADRALMEQEKSEREKVAATLAAKPVVQLPGQTVV